MTIAQKIGDPSYINPTADPATWNRLIASTPGKVGIAVANVLNGPDYQPDSAWSSVIRRERATGTKVVAYVDTGYLGTTGQTTRLNSSAAADWISQVEHDVDTWYAFYGTTGIDGIFFDQGQNACGPTSGSNTWADWYGQLGAYVKANYPGAMTVINPGYTVPQCYENTADVLLTFEGSYDTYVNNYPALNWNPVDPFKIWHLIYDTPTQANMENAISLSKSRNAGYVDVTNGVLSNPYDTIPPASYWSDEQAQVSAGGSPGSTAPSVPGTPSSSSTGGTQTTFSWAASTGVSASLAGYDITENGRHAGSVAAGTTSYTAAGLNPSTSYTFTVSARDIADNVSASSGTLSVTTTAADAHSPSAPSSLGASSTTFTSTTLSWTGSNDSDDAVAGYDVYVNSHKYLSVAAGTTSVVVGGLGTGPS